LAATAVPAKTKCSIGWCDEKIFRFVSVKYLLANRQSVS
jgi:hypothetical protein